MPKIIGTEPRVTRPQTRPSVPLDATAGDAHLVEAIRAGQTAPFEILMRRYNARLFHVARAILRDDAEAEDVVQEAYVRAWNKLAQLVGGARFAEWITRITANEALGRLRQRRRQAPEDLVPETTQSGAVLPLFGNTAPSPEDQFADGQLRTLLERSIDDLPTPFRVVFMLREVERMGTRETAKCLGLRPETVKTRLFRAKKLLRVALDRRLQSDVGTVFPFLGARCDRIVQRVFERIT
jgi:RNA polymerase sigma-70 factor (ECF subfamily)